MSSGSEIQSEIGKGGRGMGGEKKKKKQSARHVLTAKNHENMYITPQKIIMGDNPQCAVGAEV